MPLTAYGSNAGGGPTAAGKYGAAGTVYGEGVAGVTGYGLVVAGIGDAGAANVDGGAGGGDGVTPYGFIACTGCAGTGNCTRCAAAAPASSDSTFVAPNADKTNKPFRKRMPAVRRSNRFNVLSVSRREKSVSPRGARSMSASRVVTNRSDVGQ